MDKNNSHVQVARTNQSTNQEMDKNNSHVQVARTNQSLCQLTGLYVA